MGLTQFRVFSSLAFVPKSRKPRWIVARARPEAVESQRAPLFLFLIPFGLGLIFERLIPLAVSPVALLFAIALLVLLSRVTFSSPMGRWYAVFFVAAIGMGGLYGARFLPESESPDPPGLLPPREALFSVEPVQTFVAPPYSNRQIGLARIIGSDALLYYSAPASGSGEPLLPGFSAEVYGVERELDFLIPDAGFRSYLENRGAVAGVDSLAPGRKTGVENGFRATFSELLEKSKAALALGSSPLAPPTRVYQALVLGQRTGLDPGQKRIFRDTGTAHLFAISGLHVGLVGGFLFAFFRYLRVRTAIQLAGMLIILLFYVILTGSTPSAVRAFLMIAFLVGAKAFQRAYCPTSALAASALVVLLIDPAQLFTLGFQLSYVVVLSILVFGVPLAQTLLDRTDPEYWLPGQSGSPFHRVRRWVFASFSISLAAFLGSSPLIVDHFHILPISSIVLNLLLILPATFVLLLGFLSLLFGLLGLSWLCYPLNRIARAVIEAMTGLVSGTAETPLAAIPVEFANSWAGPVGTLLFLGVAFWVASRKRFLIRQVFLPVGSLLLTIGLGMVPG